MRVESGPAGQRGTRSQGVHARCDDNFPGALQPSFPDPGAWSRAWGQGWLAEERGQGLTSRGEGLQACHLE